MSDFLPPKRVHGRGASGNPAQRFSRFEVEYDSGEEPKRIKTQVFRDHATRVISRHQSPDLPFSASLNPYRGCEHGCAYCYARPTHEWLGFSAGIDFESQLFVKMDAAELLREEFSKKDYLPEPLSMSGVTDPYQPIEKKLGITRSCLRVLAETRHPVVVITKNALVQRDLDVLTELVPHQAVAVYLSVTTLDHDLARKLEPRASSPLQRLKAVEVLAAAGIPVGLSVAPIIPGLNDSEIPAILAAGKSAGASFIGYTVLRLPFSVKEVFTDWLQNHLPGQKNKILQRVEEMQGATLSNPEFGKRLKGEGVWAEQIAQLIKVGKRRSGFPDHRPALSVAAFRRPSLGGQLSLDL